MNTKLTFVHTLSPLHAGVGQGLGVIDLPIAREKATNLPYLPGSTLKGTLRDELNDDDLRNMIFGHEDSGSDLAESGSVVFTDQKLLCLPVRSLVGTFSWVTSPYILNRFSRDLQEYPPKTLKLDASKCMVSDKSANTYKDKLLILEDLNLEVESKTNADEWAEFLSKRIFQDEKWQQYFRERFCIVSDDVMNFLAETGTEVIARNKLDDETKTTVKGALWYEEALPTETILSGLLVQIKGNGNYLAEIEKISKNALQLGGSMTVGRGMCQLIIGGNDNTSEKSEGVKTNENA